MSAEIIPIRPPYQTELLDVLEATTKELLSIYELGVTYETDPITENGVVALRKAKAVLAKHGRALTA